jgi:hypothetical protein
MVTSLDARAVEDGAISRIFVQNLTFEDAAIFEREVEDVPLRCIRHRIELHNCRPTIQGLQPVTHATQVAMTTMQTPNASERLALRHLRHTGGM